MMGAQQRPGGGAGPRARHLLLLEAEIRLEQTDAAVGRVWSGHAIYGQPAPEEKAARLVYFESQAHALLGDDTYRQLPRCPSAAGLLWGQYVDRLHALKVALRTKRQQLLDEYRSRG